MPHRGNQGYDFVAATRVPRSQPRTCPKVYKDHLAAPSSAEGVSKNCVSRSGSPIPSFCGGQGGLEEVCLRHGLGEVLHQWREARLWHIRDQVVEHAALAE